MSSNAATATGGKRLEYLDSMRGLAAVAVVIFHAMIVHPAFWLPTDNPVLLSLRHWPLRLLWGGHEAVLFFFLLSGFVLAIPFVDGRAPNYPAFALKRVLRLYPPYLAAYVFTWIMFEALSSYHIDGLTSSFNDYWNRPLTPGTAMGHVLMLSHTNHINGAAWSLVDEMRFSLVFPALVLGSRWLRTLSAVALAAVVGAVGAWLGEARPDGSTWTMIVSTIATTSIYLPVFIAGIGLAAHRAPLTARSRDLTTTQRALLLVLAFGLVGCLPWRILYGEVGLMLAVAGFALILVLVLGSSTMAGALSRAPLVWLGKVSYSLYLIHSGVMYALFYGLRSRLPFWTISVLVLPVSLALAAIFQQLIESPSIRWARGVPADLSMRPLRSSRTDP